MEWLRNVLGLKPSREQFVQIAQTAIRKSGIEDELLYDSSNFAIQVKEKDGTINRTFFLENAYADYCAVPAASRTDVLSQYFSPSLELPDSLTDALPSLLPRLQSRAYYEELLLRTDVKSLSAHQSASNQIPFIPLANHFRVSVVYDSPSSVAYVNAGQFNTWNTSLEELQPSR